MSAPLLFAPDELASAGSQLDAQERPVLAYVRALADAGVGACVANASGRFAAVCADGCVLPAFLPAPGCGTWVASPHAHYVRYSAEETALLPGPARVASRAALAASSPLLPRRVLDGVVVLDALLTSTDLLPPIAPPALAGAVLALAEAYPDRAVVVRSLDATRHADHLAALADAGCLAVWSRTCWVTPADPAVLSHRDLKRDAALARASGYESRDAATAGGPERERFADLYEQLYRGKYSPLNAAYTARYFEAASRSGLMRVRALVRDGRADGVVAYYERDGVMTAPLLGYDRSLPAEAGLYRMLMLQLTREAIERGLVLNNSAGVADFKRSRGAVASAEYCAVYAAHLPRARRRAWALLETAARRVAGPLVARRGL